MPGKKWIRSSLLEEMPKCLRGQRGTSFQISDASVQMGMNSQHELLSCTRGHLSKAAPPGRSWVWSEPSLLSWDSAWYIGHPSLAMKKSPKFAGFFLFLHAHNSTCQRQKPHNYSLWSLFSQYVDSVMQLATASIVSGARNPLRRKPSLAFFPGEGSRVFHLLPGLEKT